MNKSRGHKLLAGIGVTAFAGFLCFAQPHSANAETFVDAQNHEVTAVYSGICYEAEDKNTAYWMEQGVPVLGREVYDVQAEAWHLTDEDGRIVKDKEVFLRSADNENEGKWVYYDTLGNMVKGFYTLEDDEEEKVVYYDENTGAMQHGEAYLEGGWYRFDDVTGAMVRGEYANDNGWYYYDDITGIMKKGFATISGGDSQKDVFYDEITGIMVHGETCQNDNWYRFDDVTGAMIRGEYVNEKGWYYYDENSGIMQKGNISRNGNQYYYDTITGIMSHGIAMHDGIVAKYDAVTGIFLADASNQDTDGLWTLQDNFDYIKCLASLRKTENTIEVVGNSEGADIYTDADRNLKLMQITDVHVSGAPVNYRKNLMAMNTVYEMVQRERPDFIVATGDLVFGNVYSGNEDSDAFDLILQLMDAIGIEWTWTFGNHDHDYFDRLDVNELTRRLSTSSTLYMADNDPSVKGYSNGVFRIYKDGKLENALIILDSHGEFWKDGHFDHYDYIDDSQISWYKRNVNRLEREARKQLDTFVYTHIPIREYADIDPSQYISGAKRETVACSTIGNNLADTMTSLHSTKAIFCGHDHTNDFIALYKNMYYVYSKSVDYTAYIGIENETVQRGCCILTLKTDNTFNIENKLYK